MPRYLKFLIILKIPFLLLVSYIATKTIPYLGFFPYKDIITAYGLPQFIYSLANFDGAHYINIAREGYHTYDQAFFPLYPLLIRYVGAFIGGNYLIAGLLISNISYMLGAVFFWRAIKKLFDTTVATHTLLLLLLYPSAYYFNAVYSEGIFFLLTSLTLYYAITSPVPVGLLAAATASATRIVGVVNGLYYFIPTISKTRATMYAAISSVGLIIYMFYLRFTTGDFMFFLTSQPMFGANRSSELILLPQVIFRYLKIIATLKFDISYWVAIFEFTIFWIFFALTIAYLIKNLGAKKYPGLIISTVGLLHLVVPTFTGTLQSLPRFTLFALPAFLYLARYSGNKVRLGILLCMFGMQILLFSLFIQGYFIS